MHSLFYSTHDVKLHALMRVHSIHMGTYRSWKLVQQTSEVYLTYVVDLDNIEISILEQTLYYNIPNTSMYFLLMPLPHMIFLSSYNISTMLNCSKLMTVCLSADWIVCPECFNRGIVRLVLASVLISKILLGAMYAGISSH